MVETYGIDEERFYYVAEEVPGTTPANPAMLGVCHTSLDPGFSPNNILVRGGGSIDLAAIKKGIYAPTVKLGYIVPSAAPIELLQWAKQELNKTLSCQILYWKGAFASATDITSLLYSYMRIAKASVSCDIDGIVEASLELIGQNLVTGTAKLSGATYTDHSGPIAFNETYVQKDLTVLDRVVGFRFEVNNNPKAVPVIRSTNGHLAKYVPFGKRQLNGEVRFEFESKAELDEALSDTEFDLKFGLSGTNHATLQGCKWSNITQYRLLDDLIGVTAEFDSKGPLLIAES